MTSFWRSVDKNYFGEVKEEAVFSSFEAIQAKKVRFSDKKFESGLPSKFTNSVEKFFGPKAFGPAKNSEFAQKNHQNFLRHFVVSALSYGKVLEFVRRKNVLCEKCTDNFVQILSRKFSCYPIFGDNLGKNVKALDKEANVLDKLILAKLPSLCQACSSLLKRPVSKFRSFRPQDEFLKAERLRLKENNLRLSQLIFRLGSIQRLESKQDSRAVIAFELEVQKDYLFMTLVRLEEKLLADNVYKIRGCFKNQTAEIEFISYPTPFAMPLVQLKGWNRLRESSLFRVHKANFKCYKPFYSFNV